MNGAVPVRHGGGGGGGFTHDIAQARSSSSTNCSSSPASRRLQSTAGQKKGTEKETGTQGLSRSAPAPGPGCEPRQDQGANKFDGIGEVCIPGPIPSVKFAHTENSATRQLDSTRFVKNEEISTNNPLKLGVQLKRQLSAGSNESGCSCSSSCSENLKELRVENAGLRLRVEAIDTIADAHKKTTQELDDANKKIFKLETAVGNLQSRLHKVGCDTSVDLKDDEIFIPGHDRVFVNSLICENGRLQKELGELKQSRHGKGSDGNVEKIIQELQGRVSELQTQVAIKEEQNQKAENLLNASDDVKTAKIQHLEDDLSCAVKDLKNAQTTCNMLTVETKKLQKDLEACRQHLDKTSQELATWKERAQRLEKNYLAQQKLEAPKETNLSLGDRLKIAEGQVEQLDKENSRLTEQLREVIGMNTRWQRYNEQRETFVLKLTKTNQHQQSKVTVLEKQCRELEQTINGLNSLLQELRDQHRKNTDAVVLSLEQQLVQREDRISELAEELANLRMYIQKSEDERGVQPRKEDLDMIKMLRDQVQVYKDDFEQERKDRERIQGNNEILKDRLHTTSRKLRAMELRYGSSLPEFNGKIAAAVPAYEQPRRLAARGLPQSRHMYMDGDNYEEVEIDGQDEVDGMDSNTEPLQCPKCAQEFNVSNHSAFMRHVGVCLDQ